jgi:hypothetical protein
VAEWQTRSLNGLCDSYGYLFRMWESLAIRRLGVPESAGSNPAILTGTGGRANRHDGTRLLTGRCDQPLQVRVLPLPLTDKGVLLGE